MNIKKFVKRIPIVSALAGKVYLKIITKQFRGSEKYWIERYAKGGDSGVGSYNKIAVFKAEILNNFVKEHDINSVIEYGCGDGNQLRFAKYQSYLGFDVSVDALSRCKQIFSDDETKDFKLMDDYNKERAELTLSLDVVYHLIEDEVFETYMRRLFDSSSRFVIIYSSNKDEQEKLQAPHVKHRKFTDWIDENICGWKLLRHIPNMYPYKGNVNEGSFADFYICQKS
ncbi:MAG: methyltransferase domain-containing protein [Planctomycetota bacterium]